MTKYKYCVGTKAINYENQPFVVIAVLVIFVVMTMVLQNSNAIATDDVSVPLFNNFI